MNAAATVPSKTQLSPVSSRAWLGQLIALAGLAALLYYPTLVRLFDAWWTDPNFSHGFFVPLFSGFVAWQRREELLALPLKPTWWGTVVAALGLVVLILGTLGAELFLSRFSLILLVAGMIL